MPNTEKPQGSEPAADAKRKEPTPRQHGKAWEAPEQPPHVAREAEADEEERKEKRELQRERDGGHTRPPETRGR